MMIDYDRDVRHYHIVDSLDRPEAWSLEPRFMRFAGPAQPGGQ
jgi:hypothetical protein